MTYYDAFIAKWATLSGTTQEKLAAVNSEMVAGPRVNLPVSSVTAYLLAGLKLAKLIAYAETPPAGALADSLTAAQNLVAFFKLPTPPDFKMSDPNVYAVCSAALNALAADPLTGITATDAANLLAMSATQIPWWESAGYPSIFSESDLVAAGGLN
jgi:hypothetical protein